MQEVDPNSPHVQTALAMSALTIAFVRVLQELAPKSEPLVILQRKAQVELTRLRRTPDAEMATAILGFVIDALRNPTVIDQPPD